ALVERCARDHAHLEGVRRLDERSDLVARADALVLEGDALRHGEVARQLNDAEVMAPSGLALGEADEIGEREVLARARLAPEAIPRRDAVAPDLALIDRA